MRIGLIDTGDKTFGKMPHIGLAYLSAVLRQAGHEVDILDLYFAEAEEQQAFFARDFGLVGITCTSFAFVTARQTARAIRQANPGQHIVVGGPHVSVSLGDVLEEPAFDFAIYAEGEAPMLGLVEALEAPGGHSPERLAQVDRLIWRQDGKTVVNPRGNRVDDLDALPMPDWAVFDNDLYDLYPLSSSRGCPHDCIYCASRAVMGDNRWMPRSPQSLLNELKRNVADWGKRRFVIIDDSFNIQPKRISQFCRLLLDENLGMNWGAVGIRADRADPEMLELMRRSGCDYVCVGIESANNAVLANIGKGETIEQIEAGIRTIHAAGIKVCGMFMIGNPGDTLETVRQSIAFARRMDMHMVRFYLALPMPQTRLWDWVNRNGRILSRDYTSVHDYTDVPVFETEDFSRADRTLAYREAMQVMFPDGRLPDSLRRRPDDTHTTDAANPDLGRIKPRFSPQ